MIILCNTIFSRKYSGYTKKTLTCDSDLGLTCHQSYSCTDDIYINRATLVGERKYELYKIMENGSEM